MPANPRKSAAKSAAAKLAAPAAADPEAEATPDLDAFRAEVAAETGNTDDVYVVPLAGTTVRVKHVLDWPVSVDELLFAQRFTRWAEKVLVEDDWPVWVETDPTLRQVVAFLNDLEKISGVPFGVQVTSPNS